MSLKQKYATWQSITTAIRPIWADSKQQIRGRTDLWRIIHAIPDSEWIEAVDVVPVVSVQHAWLFKTKASMLDLDLKEIQNRIARGERVTRSGEQEYNLPAYRAVMGIKDVWMHIEDKKLKVDLPDIAPLPTDVFADAGQFDTETQANINILKGLVLIYQAADGNPDTLRELIDQCLARIAAYESGTA